MAELIALRQGTFAPMKAQKFEKKLFGKPVEKPVIDPETAKRKELAFLITLNDMALEVGYSIMLRRRQESEGRSPQAPKDATPLEQPAPTMAILETAAPKKQDTEAVSKIVEAPKSISAAATPLAPEAVPIKRPEPIAVSDAGTPARSVPVPITRPAAPFAPIKPRTADIVKPQAQTLRLAPLVPPKQRATPQTLPLIYDPMDPPPLQKCSMGRKVVTSGKTAFIVGYDFRDQSNPQMVLQWAGQFKDEGQEPFRLKVSRQRI